MKDHILEFVNSGTKLSKRRGLLSVDFQEKNILIPFADIAGVLIVSDDIKLSSAVLAELIKQGVCIQFLDHKYMPGGMLVPFVGNQLARGRLLAQLSLSKTQINRFWQRIVSKKIENQARTLEKMRFDAEILFKFSLETQVGDRGHHEAQAARHYWSLIYGPEFRRDSNGAGLNSFLNYGYSILRSAVARYCVACGLNPSLGLFHKSLENPFCLIDDLMEPFRPLVDYYCSRFQCGDDLTPQIKKSLISILEHQVLYRNEKKTLRNALQQYCQNFTAAVVAGNYHLFDLSVELYCGKSERV